MRAGCHNFRAGLYHRVCRAVIWAPFGDDRIESEGHHAGCIRISVGREFLHRHLSFSKLQFSTVRHKHCRAADRGVEHLYKTLLAHHVRVAEVVHHFLFQ